MGKATRENVFFMNRAGEKLSALLDKPEKPNGIGIIFLHCFLCTKDYRLSRKISERLAKDGFTVLRFDFSGNGESEGKIEDATYTKMIDEVKAAVTFMKNSVDKMALAGHSMGAMLALMAASDDERIGAVAFISGSSEAARVRQIFPSELIAKAESEGVAEVEIYGRKLKLKREFLLDIEKYNTGHIAAEFNKPLLIVHGTADDVINPYHARQLYGWASEPKKLHLIEGADHLFKNEKHLGELEIVVGMWFAKIFNVSSR